MYAHSPESSFEFLSCRSKIFWLFHDFTNDLFLALKIVIVEVTVHLLQDLYPSQNVENVEVGVRGIVRPRGRKLDT